MGVIYERAPYRNQTQIREPGDINTNTNSANKIAADLEMQFLPLLIIIVLFIICDPASQNQQKVAWPSFVLWLEIGDQGQHG